MRRLHAVTEWMVQTLVVLAVAIGMVLQAHRLTADTVSEASVWPRN